MAMTKVRRVACYDALSAIWTELNFAPIPHRELSPMTDSSLELLVQFWLYQRRHWDKPEGTLIPPFRPVLRSPDSGKPAPINPYEIFGTLELPNKRIPHSALTSRQQQALAKMTEES